MAASDTTDPSEELSYTERPWGEMYCGTKAELQSIGIAVDMAFPGEPGAPKRKLLTRDPRGLEVVVTHSYDGRYYACINLPGRERPTDQWRDFAPGVQRRSDCYWFDEYVGTAEALATAGLVRLDQLPGQPGMRKVRVQIFSDGTIPIGPPTTKHKRSRDPGAKTIERTGKATYRVRVIIPEDEEKARQEKLERVEKEWEARMRAMPRPKPLIAANNRKRQAETEEEFREKTIKRFNLYLGNFKMDLVDKDGYGYDDETLGEIERLTAELEDLLDEGGIVQSLDEENPATVQSNAPAHKADTVLQSFLKSVTSNLSLVKNEKPEGI